MRWTAPLVVLLEQDGTDETGDGGFVREDADDLGASLDLAIETFERIGGVELGSVLGREAHVGEHVRLGVIHQDGELWQLGPELISDATPLSLCQFGIVLGEGRGDEGRDNASTAPAGVGQRVAHEVNAAALPGGDENLRDRRLSALVGVGDDQLHSAQAAPGKLVQERRPECLGLRWADVLAEHFAPAIALTPTATDTMRPPRLADLQVGGVDPQIRPVALDRPVEKSLDPLVDLPAQPAHLALGDAGHAHGLDQIIDRAGRDALDVGLLDHCRKRLLGHAPGLEEAREVAAVAQLGDAQLDRAGSGLPQSRSR